MGSLPYRFSEFGWLQFERACSLILAEAGAVDPEWLGHADTGRVAFLADQVTSVSGERALAGPLTALVIWQRSTAGDADATARLVTIVNGLPEEIGCGYDDHLLVLTNLDATPVRRALGGLASLKGRAVVVWGAAELGEWFDRRLAIRQALPSVLGSRELSGVISQATTAASTFDVERAGTLAGVFWPTEPYARARMILGRHRFVVLTGPPEMGKTAIAQMLALVQMSAGWEAHECSSPDQLFRAFDRRREQVFIADDAFGSTEYRPDAAERWAIALGRLLAMLDDSHWLVWTSRPAPLKAGLRRVQRERGAERFPAPGEVLVDAADLDLAEKTLILFRHARARDASDEARTLLRMAAMSIIEHPHFTPERIRRFVGGPIETLPKLAAEGGAAAVELTVERELATPTEAMRTSFRALGDGHRKILVALLDAPAGLIDRRALIATARRHGAAVLSSSPEALIDRLTDHFLRVTPLGIGWVHPSWRDLVIDELGSDPAARGRFLDSCGVDGATLALSRAGGSGGRRLPLLSNDEDWDRLASTVRRLVRELEAPDLARLLLTVQDAVFHHDGLAAARDEAQALATLALETTARRWNAHSEPIPRFLIDAWYRLSKSVEASSERLELRWTWAGLHPSTPGDGALERAALIDADDWLGLVETLAGYDPPALRALGFFDRDQLFLTELVTALQRTTGADTSDLVEGILRRIQRVAPRHFEVAEIALAELARATSEAESWWVPEDLAAPPSTERVVRGPVQFNAADIGRVFADL